MKTILILALLCLGLAQNIGTQKQEYHLPFPYQECTSSGCNTKNGEVTLDQNWRWIHNVGGYQNCFTGIDWDKSFCPDGATCSRNCAVDGVPQGDWINPYGTRTVNKGIEMTLVTKGQYGDNVGARVYLMENSNQYLKVNLLNKEFSFTADVSNLACGINGALYFVEMEADGGSSKYPSNKAGARYGTGYCDAQCPHDVKFIQGEANCEDWKDDKGKYGSCCAELDIWEANKEANAFTAHPCSQPGNYKCSGIQCGDKENRQKGVCDKDGFDINPYRNGNKDFYGPGSNYKVDTTQPFQVVSQFITADNTDNGELSEIKQFYVQNGKKIEVPPTKIPGLGPYNSLTNQNCQAQKSVFGEAPTFLSKGGMKTMGEAMKRGMVLVMSLWDDDQAYMLWLDSDYPLEADPSKPGVKRGRCSRDSGRPVDVRKQFPNAHTSFSSVKFGTIGSTVLFEEDGITAKQIQSQLSQEKA